MKNSFFLITNFINIYIKVFLIKNKNIIINYIIKNINNIFK